MPIARPTKMRAEEQVEGGVAAAERAGEELGACRSTMPPPANAPRMPSTRPRTSGVWPMYFQPSTNWRSMLCSVRSPLGGLRLPLISLMPKNTTSAVASREKRVEVQRELGGLGPARAGRRSTRPDACGRAPARHERGERPG